MKKRLGDEKVIESNPLSENESPKKGVKAFSSSSKSSQLTNAIEKKMVGLKVPKVNSQDTEKSESSSVKGHHKEVSKSKTPTSLIPSQVSTTVGQTNPSSMNQLNLLANQTPTPQINYLDLGQLLAFATGQGFMAPLPFLPNSGMPAYMPNIFALSGIPQTANQKLPTQETRKLKPIIQISKLDISEDKMEEEISSPDSRDKIHPKVIHPKPIHSNIKESAFKKVRKA